MSNHLAFATLTYTLQRQLDRVVAADVSGATATAVRPDTGGVTEKGVNIYLLQANPSGEMGSLDLPTRSTGGGVANKPQSVWELIYLLTFHGSEIDLEPQRAQASVLRRLHGTPFVSRDMVREAVTAAVSGDANHFLRDSNLADQISTVKLTPYKVTLDELSRVWSVLFQSNYALSSTYKATYVVLDSEAAGQASLPVRHRGPFSLPLGGPQIARILPDRIPYSATADVTLQGESLVGAGLRYFVDDAEAALQPGGTAQAATIRMPALAKAGVRQIRVFAAGPLGAGHQGTESNVVPILLLPSVNTIAYHNDPSVRKDHTIEVTPEMSVGLEQRLSLLLNRTDGVEPSSYELSARTRAAEGDPIVFAARDVAPGSYMYRLRVDGLDSPLTLDTSDSNPLNQPYNGPLLVVTP